MGDMRVDCGYVMPMIRAAASTDEMREGVLYDVLQMGGRCIIWHLLRTLTQTGTGYAGAFKPLSSFLGQIYENRDMLEDYVHYYRLARSAQENHSLIKSFPTFIPRY